MNKILVMSLLAMGLMSPLYGADKQPAAMSPQQEKMMADMQKMAAPNEHHKVLEPMVGNWTFTSRMWMKPGDKPEESKGTLKAEWVYGNRFLKRDFKLEMAGHAMAGTGYLGYDNTLGEYQELWLGDMGTGMMMTHGTYDAASKTLKLAGTTSCAMTGEKNKPVRMEVHIPNNDSFTYTMFDKTADGKEFKMVVETYQRVK
jgi:hypothetical protein